MRRGRRRQSVRQQQGGGGGGAREGNKGFGVSNCGCCCCTRLNLQFTKFMKIEFAFLMNLPSFESCGLSLCGCCLDMASCRIMFYIAVDNNANKSTICAIHTSQPNSQSSSQPSSHPVRQAGKINKRKSDDDEKQLKMSSFVWSRSWSCVGDTTAYNLQLTDQ